MLDFDTRLRAQKIVIVIIDPLVAEISCCTIWVIVSSSNFNWFVCNKMPLLLLFEASC